MKPKRWMVLAWVAILAIIILATIMDGSKNCEVSKSGPFHWILAGHKFVPAHAGKIACYQVK
ncbi:MAG: hypothetical protein ABI898_06380 [Sphingomonadales bacterium]